MATLTINGERYELDVPDDMPLLWVIRDVVGLKGTKFGCGMSQCGACTVHLNGTAIRSCVTPVSAASGEITTIEAMADDPVGSKVQQACEGSQGTRGSSGRVTSLQEDPVRLSGPARAPRTPLPDAGSATRGAPVSPTQGLRPLFLPPYR